MQHPAHPADWLWWHQFGIETQKWTNMRCWDKKTSMPHACHHRPSGCILHCGSACGWNAGFKLLRWLGKSGESLWIMLSALNVSKQTTGWGDNVVVARTMFRDNISLSESRWSCREARKVQWNQRPDGVKFRYQKHLKVGKDLILVKC